MSKPRVIDGAIGLGEADKSRDWYRHASEDQFELIIDHIRDTFPAHPDVTPPSVRTEAWRRVQGGEWDGMREYPDGARHYLVRALDATVYVSAHGTEYVDVHADVNAHWKAIMAGGAVDKDGDCPKPAPRMTGDAS